MKVGELIRALEAFDPELAVIIPRSEGGGLEDVVACYEDIICKGRGIATYEVLEPWIGISHIDPTSSQRVIVMDMDPQESGVNVG
ncbi:hypothetical protein LOY28_15410 [Pseudomonas sp. B21-017]|uniref:hypothetical protein n=1 Tax=Pseudomonas sp. B21-017 TaxID=2895474 RepID=UPI0021604857|nr:hypothetical protein [Pseudomonas sp. B21-017]UVM36128.1 hypothetical protein LOY28_15410 [Pseudomonas sp. B21-017]